MRRVWQRSGVCASVCHVCWPQQRRAAGLLLSAVRAGDIDRQRRAPSAQQQRQQFEILRCSRPIPAISVKAHLNTVDYFNSNKAVCVYCVYICVCVSADFLAARRVSTFCRGYRLRFRPWWSTSYSAGSYSLSCSSLPGASKNPQSSKQSLTQNIGNESVPGISILSIDAARF